jgi:AraC-like DNA-binding protein
MDPHRQTCAPRDEGGHLDRRPDAADPRFELVHPETLRFFPDLVQDLGGDAPALLQQARIDPFIFSRRDAVLEYRSFVQLLELAAAQLRRSDLGLRLAQIQAANRVMGPVGVVMKNSATVGQALGYCAKHIHAYSLATRVRFRPDRANHRLFVGLELLLDRAPQAAQAIEHGLLLAHRNIMEISGSAARARSVSFRHSALSAPATYRAAFGCEVRFEQTADGIVLTEDDLLCTIVEADEQIYEMATSFIDARYPHALPPLHAQVRALVAKSLAGADCTNERIAAELCMHPRTLQRRLRADGASFEGIKDGVRREMAIHLLQKTPLPLAHVAEKLGYAEASVLSRSCFRWFGAPPLKIRRESSAFEACAAVA